MNLPNIISKLLKAQNEFNSKAYADCFTENAEVFDEGKTHNGKAEIEKWIDKANKEYRATMEPLEYNETENILSAEISGTFPGSPIVLKYHFQFADHHIQSLKITG
ncbi:nuclear transport factor 2 family protein [Sphingobacterium siyangense]|uniref:nuclear transport factor 2 family protein n=1 Tax=Sphingobacterium siyangense TaxID=459529 RepID=UPI001962DC31|nr:nuclear transport factor 2 family protein [Sphingobacterium siyangense]QRY56009.1 nuclear transport factor 2 family protein [Sphingobacterium siyangense]